MLVKRNTSLTLVLVLVASVVRADEKNAELKIAIDDADGKAMPCRVHLYDSAGKPQQAPGLPFFRDHFVCDGRVTLSLPLGKYRYEIERGPEHERMVGQVELKPGAGQVVKGRLRRLAEMSKLGWYSGDLHIHRPLADIELLMKAEDLDIGPVITWWNKKNPWTGDNLPRNRLKQFDGGRFYHSLAGEDERGGGALLYFHLDEPLEITKAEREFPSPLRFANEARQKNKNVWIDVEKPFWWDAPTWLASGLTDSIGIANNHMCRSQVFASEAWGKARDEKQFPPPLGNGRWTQEIYYHILNCGLRVPPSAGSASGVLPNPLGYNRVYVHVEGDLTWDKWWAGLKAGRSFVTNGPLLLVTADGKMPGTVFTSPDGKALTLKLDIPLTSLDKVSVIEIVRDGRVAKTIDAENTPTFRGEATIEFKESGWFLVRAVADNKETFRFASTAPFYVEIGKNDRRISRKSATFFRDWTDERIAKLRTLLKNEKELAEVLKPHEEARTFWGGLIDKANAE